MLCVNRFLYVTYVYVPGINVMIRLRYASRVVFYVFRTRHYAIFGKVPSQIDSCTHESVKPAGCNSIKCNKAYT